MLRREVRDAEGREVRDAALVHEPDDTAHGECYVFGSLQVCSVCYIGRK